MERLLVLALASSACSPRATFSCASDPACGPGGRCEPSGFCSFADATCPSGQRYDDHAGGGLGGRCVDEEPAGDAPDGAATVHATTATTLYTVVPSTGAATKVGDYDCTSDPVADLAVSSAGAMFIVVRTAAPATVLCSVDPATAACTQLGMLTGIPAGTAITALAFVRGASGDRLIGANDGPSGRVFEIDPAGLAAADLGAHDGGFFTEGDLSYVTSRGLFETVTNNNAPAAQQLATIELDPGGDRGHATLVGATLRRYEGLVTSGGELYGFAGDGTIAKIDPANGGELASNNPDPALVWSGAAAAPPAL